MLYQFYQQMFLIRKTEEKLLSLFTDGRMKGTVHTCIGQEACAVGTMMCIDRDKDLVFSNHRGHGHLLAYGIQLDTFFGELLGKISGPSRGIGGSQHMLWKNFMTSGIQGSLLPIGVGAALAEKKKNSGAISVIFMGDGTMGQGIVYESFNFAALWEIPVIFVLENNGYAQTTKLEDAHFGDIGKRASSFGIESYSTDGNDVEGVHALFSAAVQKVRKKSVPAFVELKTHRLCAHSKGDDTRPEREVAAYWEKDPLKKLESQLSESTISSIQSEIISIVDEAATKAIATPSLCYDSYKRVSHK